jgi:hypothetical protein
MNKGEPMSEDIQFRFTACSPPGCRCPDVEFDNGLVTISDDYGGKVKLTIDELEYIASKTHNLIEHIREDRKKQQEELLKQIEEKKKERMQ